MIPFVLSFSSFCALGGGGGLSKGSLTHRHLEFFFSFCLKLRVPRKCSVRRTGSVWQVTYNICHPVRRTHSPSEDGGMYPPGGVYLIRAHCHRRMQRDATATP